MFKLLDQSHNNLVAIRVEDKIEKEDYDRLNLIVDEALSNSRRAKLYLEMGNVDGITPSVIWEDAKFDFKNYDNIEKVAVVGNREWEKWMTKVYSLFTAGKVKFFKESDKEKAFTWLEPEMHIQGT